MLTTQTIEEIKSILQRGNVVELKTERGKVVVIEIKRQVRHKEDAD